MAPGSNTDDAVGSGASHDQIVQAVAVSCNWPMRRINIGRRWFRHERQLGPGESSCVVVMTGEVCEMIRHHAVL